MKNDYLILRKVILMMITFLFYLNGVCQVRVTGKVISSEDNQGLPGVNVIVKGTTAGTVTDIEGAYSINVPSSEAVLVFSSVGYESEEIALAGRTTIDVTLIPDIKALSEVVVIGYGTVKKSDLTGSLSSVKAKELTAFPTTNALQALAGRAAGVQVIQNTGAPGGAISVRVRGTNSIQGNNEPLYVVDGFPVSGNPTLLNNSDIESIEVLKDASATAIYGSRGANGVVLITTKRGKAGTTRVDYEGSYSVQNPINKLDLMNARQYAEFQNLQAANDNLTPYFSPAEVSSFGEGTDWQDLVYQPAPLHNHGLTVSGGSEKTQFSVGAGYFDQKGIIIGSDYVRTSLRANINHDISKVFNITYGATLSKINSDRKNSGGDNRGSSLISGMVSAPPTLTPYNEDGTYRVLATAYPFISNVMRNPLNFLYAQSDIINSNKVLANAAFTLKPTEGLTIKISGGIENSDDRTDVYTTRNFINSPGSASVSSNQYTSLLNENIVSYTKTIGGIHDLSFTGGFTYQDYVSKSLNASGTGFISDVPETFDIGAADVFNTPESSYSKWVLLSYLGRMNYSLKGKYLATVSFRADGSSRYSVGQKWGYFPSGALAWRISDEEFLKNVSTISNLKLRLGWGKTGSTAIGPYYTLNSLSSGKTVFGDALYTTYAPATRLPSDLKWETTAQTNFGIDLGLFADRINLTADYYIKNTEDLLNTVPLPSSLGYTYTVRNIGSIRNQGVEFTLDGRIFTGDFKWDLSTNISFNRNEVVSLYNNEDVKGQSINITVVNDYINLLREGEPLGTFYGFIENGYTETGKIVYKDFDENGIINELDKRIIGDPNPDFTYGFNSNMSFKNFDFTFFIQGSQGNDIFNLSSINQTMDYGFGLNMPVDLINNTWTPENPNAKYPKVTRTNSVNISDRYVEDGSYIRLKNIQLAYNIPVQNFGIEWMRSGQIYVSGQNLLTVTNYSWIDPEINSYGGSNSIRQGIDHYSYPTNKAVTVGVRLGF